jgi:hypothetical protein
MEKKMMYVTVYKLKNELVSSIIETIGERTIDLSGEGVSVTAVEHHCGEAVSGTLGPISGSGFYLGDDCDNIELVWKDMIVEDLAIVHDNLIAGIW